MNSVEDLTTYIQKDAKDKERYVIALAGFGGAGKSTLSEQLRTILGNATLIHTDDFIAADENGALEGYHLDWKRLENETLKPIHSAKTVTSKIYDWKGNAIVFKEIPVKRFVIFEGSIWLLDEKLKKYFDMTVWIDVPQTVANARGKKRDNEEYGVDHDDLWDTVWGPREHDSFIKLRPDVKADILLKNNY